MNLFEPQGQSDVVPRPATLKRIVVSVVCGAALGVGLAALIFSLSWLGHVGQEGGPFSSWWLAYLVALAGLELWHWARRDTRGGRVLRGTLLHAISSIMILIGVGFVFWRLVGAGAVAWVGANKEFATLLVMCGFLGAILTWWSLRLWQREGPRVGIWFSAAAMLWLTSEWTVRLGPSLGRWDDPRYSAAAWVVFGTGALLLAGIVAVMDWHIRRRDAVVTEQGGSAPDGPSND